MNAKPMKWYAVLVAALAVACGGGKQPGPPDPHRDQVNAYLDSLPVGDPPRPRTVETLSSELDRLDDTSGPKACASESRHITEDFDEVALLATANANVVPGLAIQAKTVTDGTIQPVPLARGPMTYVIDLPLADTHVDVDQVALDSAQQAVSTLQLRAADVDAPARLSFTAEVASSLEQAAHNVGVGAQFSLGLVNAGFGVSFGGSRSLSFRTIVAKLIQPMYTVSVADDKITHTADFFAENIGIDDVNGIEAQGLIGPDNQPTFIKSVTYGRVLYYSISTEDAADNEELTAAVNASYRGFGGNIDAKNSYDRIMSRAIVEVLALGGSQDDALAAIRSGDFSLFFKPVKVAQAIPISYKLNYMQGDRGVVAIRSALDYTMRDCTACSPVKKTESRVVYSKPYDEAGGVFGRSINDLFGGACSAGWSQGQVERPVFGGGGTCDARFASTDPNDCRVLVHIGIPAFQGVKCQIDARETREIPGQPPLCPPSAP